MSLGLWRSLRAKQWCLWIVVLKKILRVPWIARRSNQSILKEINPEYSLEALISSVLFNRSVVSDSLRPHRLQHAMLPYPSTTPGACSKRVSSSHQVAEVSDTEAPILWPLDAKNQLIGKYPDAGKDWGQKEKGVTENEMVGWHHQLNAHEFEQALGDAKGQGDLACNSPLGHKESDMT